MEYKTWNPIIEFMMLLGSPVKCYIEVQCYVLRHMEIIAILKFHLDCQISFTRHFCSFDFGYRLKPRSWFRTWPTTNIDWSILSGKARKSWLQVRNFKQRVWSLKKSWVWFKCRNFHLNQFKSWGTRSLKAWPSKFLLWYQHISILNKNWIFSSFLISNWRGTQLAWSMDARGKFLQNLKCEFKLTQAPLCA